jgi:voltage-gated potassium channel
MAVIQKTLSGHIIVAGYGTTGSETVDELIARGTDAGRIVVIDTNEEHLSRAKACGCIVLQADATRDQVLNDVRIANAEAMIVCAGRDDTSILITLTARHLAPALPISVIVRNEDNELPARAAGATTVVNPVSFAGLLLAGSCHGAHLSDYLMDLASIHGQVQLTERAVRAEEIGKPLSAIATGLGVRIFRDGQPYSFAEPETRALLAGDTILEIVTG